MCTSCSELPCSQAWYNLSNLCPCMKYIQLLALTEKIAVLSSLPSATHRNIRQYIGLMQTVHIQFESEGSKKTLTTFGNQPRIKVLKT